MLQFTVTYCNFYNLLYNFCILIYFKIILETFLIS